MNAWQVIRLNRQRVDSELRILTGTVCRTTEWLKNWIIFEVFWPPFAPPVWLWTAPGRSWGSYCSIRRDHCSWWSHLCQLISSSDWSRIRWMSELGAFGSPEYSGHRSSIWNWLGRSTKSGRHCSYSPTRIRGTNRICRRLYRCSVSYRTECLEGKRETS